MARSGAGDGAVVWSKADSRYWLVGKRLCFHDSANYSARIQGAGRREWFPLGTPNKKKAAAKAAEIYAFIQAHGYEAAVARFKPETIQKAKLPTVGALIEAGCRISSARSQSLEAYVKAFRRIVSEVKGIKLGKASEGEPGALHVWRSKVDAVLLSDLTPSVIVAWKNSRLRAAESDPLAKRRAITTVNSLIRNAKALFGRKILPFIAQDLDLPAVLPFDGVALEKAPSMRYKSSIDAFAILALAKEQLGVTDPEGFKVLLLALVCGLRRSEIDNLLWRSFDFANRRLRIETTEYHQLKSEDSAGDVDLDGPTLAQFRGFRAKSPTALFVVDSEALPVGVEPRSLRKVSKPSRETKTRTYRCNAVFGRVLDWLRAHGVDSSKPLHTLRKEIGSIIASEHGIFEASRYLRHSDIRMTASVYADKKKVVTPRTFEGLLAAPAGGAELLEFLAAGERQQDEGAERGSSAGA